MTSLFKRAPESERRRELIEATLECISEVGIQATTVRAVAARAGVTNGLIRHHFENKANLIVEAYRRTMELITASSMAILEGREGGKPHQRLLQFIKATLEGQASDDRMLSLWATFISQNRVDPMIMAVRDESYANLRRATEPLLAEVFTAEGRAFTPAEIERAAICVHAILDGLWLEACLDQRREKTDMFVQLAKEMIEKVLDTSLSED
ncbi:BetI family transcriptional regulator [Brucella intermedia 229E]|uniref:BetI family transcriptional regulator n=1 Tax=Brucella intermedia 229E TaxID=1337887 RepID=U4VDQ7_9HYPH|nr:BetI family transcriptional regulator [Brucella intermedia 229E]